jgi:CubicO group peptidase (beta-lactamase class C family)
LRKIANHYGASLNTLRAWFCFIGVGFSNANLDAIRLPDFCPHNARQCCRPAQDVPAPKVDQIFSVYDKSGSPGCALGVIRDGDFVYRKAYGLANLELGVPLSAQSVFYMGSVSKQVTAASVVLAAEQGYLSLDDDVRKYIPELPDYGHVVTLRQMIHQTSGFRDFYTLLGLSGHDAADFNSPEEIFEIVARQRGLNNIPGDEWIYSNTNYFLLGMVVQRASKKTLAEFAAESIFKPLGMSHTLFYDGHTVVVPLGLPHMILSRTTAFTWIGLQRLNSWERAV